MFSYMYRVRGKTPLTAESMCYPSLGKGPREKSSVWNRSKKNYLKVQRVSAASPASKMACELAWL